MKNNNRVKGKITKTNTSPLPIICKVWKAKKANQKLITIPAKSNIQEKDYVSVIKIEVNRK